jgi:hypothetical protein
VHFVIKSCILVAKEKSITLAFGCWVSEAGFNVLMHLLDFWFGGGSFLNLFLGHVLGSPLFRPRSFSLAPYIFAVASFSSDVFFLSSLCFGVASIFIESIFSEPLAFWGCLFFIRGLFS